MKNGNDFSPCNLGLCCDVKSNYIAFYLFGVMLHPLGTFGGMTWTSSTNNEKHFNLLDRTGKIIMLFLNQIAAELTYKKGHYEGGELTYVSYWSVFLF
ncbi:hypothetical protein VNO80_04095 [Phaseolus coccineus]|uniref:Uncharacterized protein n=1 Tax=Phaseolus coccineus TaxID=3886 RepID=A0AAN9RNI4_PHACN